MAWSGSITDREGARRSAGAILMGQNVLGVLEASLSSVSVAQAAAATKGASLHIADQGWSTRQIQRAYQVASNYSATFSSSYNTLYASLPSSADHQRSQLQG